MARIGVAKVYWQDLVEPIEQEFEGTVESLMFYWLMMLMK